MRLLLHTLIILIRTHTSTMQLQLLLWLVILHMLPRSYSVLFTICFVVRHWKYDQVPFEFQLFSSHGSGRTKKECHERNNSDTQGLALRTSQKSLSDQIRESLFSHHDQNDTDTSLDLVRQCSTTIEEREQNDLVTEKQVSERKRKREREDLSKDNDVWPTNVISCSEPMKMMTMMTNDQLEDPTVISVTMNVVHPVRSRSYLTTATQHWQQRVARHVCHTYLRLVDKDVRWAISIISLHHWRYFNIITFTVNRVWLMSRWSQVERLFAHRETYEEMFIFILADELCRKRKFDGVDSSVSLERKKSSRIWSLADMAEKNENNKVLTSNGQFVVNKQRSSSSSTGSSSSVSPSPSPSLSLSQRSSQGKTSESRVSVSTNISLCREMQSKWLDIHQYGSI